MEKSYTGNSKSYTEVSPTKDIIEFYVEKQKVKQKDTPTWEVVSSANKF